MARGDRGMTQQMTADTRALYRAVTAGRVTEADHYRAPVLSLFWVWGKINLIHFVVCSEALMRPVGYSNLIHTLMIVMWKKSLIGRKRVTSDFPGRVWPQPGLTPAQATPAQINTRDTTNTELHLSRNPTQGSLCLKKRHLPLGLLTEV